MKKLIIIPAYNESECIERTVKDIQKCAQGFDYVIINDCSTDHTKEICEKNGFHLINLPINLGIGGAVQTGYRYAYENGYDIAVQFDGDGQHDASFLIQMADTLQKEKADMVIGSRFIEKVGFQSSLIRRVGIVYFTRLIKLLTGTTITDPTSGLRMINRSVIKIFANDYPKDYPEPESVVAVLKNKKIVKEMPVVMHERQGGTSSIGSLKSIYYMIKVTLAILVESLRRYQ
ncbi:MAG: glycosyltransferase family 2 protein [Lachnospiraceae bacterium]|jgi:glycosyltransferase involved in cell wall biosynthesis|nr:glycosyltransferase family 2 protein [Lachnospiraceae bacterium]